MSLQTVTRYRIIALGLSVLLLVVCNRVTAQPWRQYAKTEHAGWSATELETARRFASSIGSGAVMVLDHGHVVAAWGHIDHPYKSASIRKSVYDATIGATHFAQPFNVDTTIGQLKIDDIEPLTSTEKRATFEHLLTARSGVYHPAAYESKSNADRRPKRGSATPGTLWYYNNWDFNTVCVAFERLSGESIEQAFTQRLATTLGMQDFKPDHIFEWLEPRISRYPAPTFRLSARDLARVGQLYILDGVWDEKRIVSSEWIKRSTAAHTVFEAGHYRGEGNGYGRLWWVWPARPERNSAYDAHLRIAARGTGGQIMVLFPKIDVVIVQLSDTDGGRGISGDDGVQLLNMIMASREGDPASRAALDDVRVEKLSEKPPTPLREPLSILSEERRKMVAGDYAYADNVRMRFYPFEGRLFVQPLGLPYTDAELFQTPDGVLRSPLVRLTFEPIQGAGGIIDEMRMTFRGQTQMGKRVK